MLQKYAGLSLRETFIRSIMNCKINNNNVFSMAEIIYLLYFSVMTLAKGFGLYDGMWPYTLSLFAGAILIITKLVLTEHTIAEWFYILSLITLGVIIFYNSSQTGALIYITMIIGLKNVSLKRLFPLALFLWSSTFILQSLLTMTGLKNDIFVIHEKLGLGHLIRWSLGQPHPNVLQITFLIICAMILYLANLKGRKLIFTTFIMFLANLYIFFYSISYTGLILVIFYLFANLYLSLRSNLCSAEKLAANLVFPGCIAFALLGPVYFPQPLWNICNKLLNTRFNIAKVHLTLDPIPLFGSRPSHTITQGLHNIDSSYVFALMRYGIILFSLMCIAYIAYIYHCTKEKKYNELAITLGLSVAAIAEPFFINPSFKNISLLFVGEFIFIKLEQFCRNKQDSLLSKKILLCSWGRKEIYLPIDSLKNRLSNYGKFIHKKQKLLLGTFLCFGILMGSVFAVTADIPKRYYALRTSTQMETKDHILLDMENLPDDFEGSKVLNYKDATTPMQMFEGNICTVEYVRGIISSGLWGGAFITLLISVILLKYKN